MELKSLKQAEYQILSSGPHRFSPAWITLILSIIQFAESELFENGQYKPLKWVQFSRIWRIAIFFVNTVSQLIKIL